MTIRTDQNISDTTIRAVEGPPLREELAAASGLVGKGKLLFQWWKSTRAGRAMARVGTSNGNLLAGGISYAALFSVFAAITIGWTAFMLVLGRNVGLRDQLITTINDALPGIIDDGTGGLVSPEDLVLDTAFTPASIVAALVLLWSALSMMTALKSSIRAMFGLVAVPEDFVLTRLRDAAGFAILALAVLVTSVLSIAANTLGNLVFDWIGADGPFVRLLLQLGTLLVAAAVDFGVYVFLFRVLAGMHIPRRDLLLGAGLGAVASGAIRYLGTSLIGVSADPLLASATALVTILLWVNLISRVALIVAAFTANPPAPVQPKKPGEVHFGETPNYVTVSEPRTLAWDHQAVTGTIEPIEPAGEGPAEPERTPRWGGLIGYAQRRRIEGLERRLAAARESYYR